MGLTPLPMYDYLQGIRVLNLSRNLPGPYACHILAELGADVLHVEEPGMGDPMRILPPYVGEVGYAFAATRAGQKSLALDLKGPGAREMILAHARTARVFFEGFRPGVTERLGLDYPSVRAVRPDVVYCSLTGYGQEGPDRDRPGHDINFLGMAGILSLGPLPGVTMADFCGGQWAAIAILAALRKPESVRIDVSLTQAVRTWTVMQAGYVFREGRDPAPEENFLAQSYACYRTYETADGKRLTVGALEPKFWLRFCDIVERPDFVSRQWTPADQGEMIRSLEEIFRTAPRAEWLRRLSELPVAPVLSLTEALADPRSRERFGEEALRVASPARFEGVPSSPPGPAPRL